MTRKGYSRMREKPLISAIDLRKFLFYEPSTGIFIWRTKSNQKSQAKLGSTAGSINERGYIRIVVAGRVYQGHRLAWLYFYGSWPVYTIDHIDGCKSNNRITNLRDVTMMVNNQNRRRAQGVENTSGLLGVTRAGSAWQAGIGTGGRSVYLGRFASKEAAHDAYVSAKRVLHEGNTL